MTFLRRAILIVAFVSATANGELTRYRSGSETDARLKKLGGPYLILAGGGGDQADAMQAAIDGVRGCSDCEAKIDVVVLRASGAEGYNPFFMSMNGVNSIVSMVVTDRASAERDDVVQSIRNAEVVFFAGGDQCNYIRWIKGTKAAEAVKAVYRKGGAVGGSSAGLAIQGQIVYDACPNQSAKSEEVLRDPYHEDVSLTYDFFEWPLLRGIITDSHFQQHDRMGRLLVFMSRALAQPDIHRVRGLGISEATVLLVDRKSARVFGKGPVHVIVAEGEPQSIQRRQPLTAYGFRIWRYEGGETIDLRRDPKTPEKTVDVVAGKLSENPY